MFDFVIQMVVLALIFLPTLLSLLYLCLAGSGKSKLSLRSLALGIASLQLLGAATVFFAFPAKMETEFSLLQPVSSALFSLSFVLSIQHAAWLGAGSLLFIHLLWGAGRDIFTEKKPLWGFASLSLAFLSALFCFLTKQIFVIFIFAEISLLMLHLFQRDGLLQDPETSPATPYFKRVAFLFGAFFVLAVLQPLGLLAADAVILLGTILYSFSLCIFLPELDSWVNVVSGLLSTLLGFYLFSSVWRPGLATDLWLPLSLVFFGLLAIFAVVGIISRSGRGTLYWFVTTYSSVVFMMEFSSGQAALLPWTLHAIFTVLAIAMTVLLLEMQQPKKNLLLKNTCRALAAILVASVVGAMPNICLVINSKNGSSYDALLRPVMIFLSAILLAKQSFYKEENFEDYKLGKKAFWGAVGFSLLLFVSQYAGLVWLSAEGELGNFEQIINNADYLLLLLGPGLFAFGYLIGFFLSTQRKFLLPLQEKSWFKDGLFSGTHRLSMKTNATITTMPATVCDQASSLVTAAVSTGSSGTKFFEEELMQKTFWSESQAYLAALSRYVRFFHRGSVRFYMFMMLFVFLAWSAALFFS